jgi:hypothetical protein
MPCNIAYIPHDIESFSILKWRFFIKVNNRVEMTGCFITSKYFIASKISGIYCSRMFGVMDSPFSENRHSTEPSTACVKATGSEN